MSTTTIVSNSATILQESGRMVLTILSSNTAAGVLAEKTQQALDAIDSAADTAMFTAGMYPDTALGLAGTVDGEYFSVPSPEADEFSILYQNVAGSAVEKKRFGTAAMSQAAIDAAAVAEAAADFAFDTVQGVADVAIYNTKAEATAAASGLADQALVMVLVDESLAGIKSLYRKESGSLVFKQELLTKDVVDAAVVDAEAAKTAAESARDAAIIGAVVYVNEPTGRAAVADGVAFKVQGSGDVAAYEYRRVNSGSSTLIATYPAASAVQKPSRTGKYNGWPDPFFRHCAVDKNFLGRDRWHVASGSITSLELAANTTFNGKSLRKNASGTGNLSGPRIWMDDMGAVAGDTITIRALVVGDGAVVAFPVRPLNSSGTAIGVQQNASPITVTASATPQLMTISFATPALTESLHVYPYTNTAGKTFDVVALWAYKGAAADGPEWPTFNDEDYLRLKALEVDSNTASIAENTEAVAAVTESRTAVSSTSETVALNVSSIGTAVNFGSPFTGWGERYTPAGISFNAVRVKQVGRRADLTTEAQRWRTLNVVIRTGANSHQSGATIVAIGSATVVESADTLTDVTALLRDPTTNALKTLSDLDFSGSEYFIGIYARTAAGIGASMSEHLATQANSLGQSYYLTSGTPTTSTWLSSTPNRRVGVQHLLLVSPTESLDYQPSASFLESIEITPTVPTPVVVLPPTFYGLQGRENSIYFDNITPAAGSEYYWDVSGISVGQQQSERWTWTATGASGAVTATISLHDKLTGVQLGSGAVSVKAAASTAGSGSTKTCMFVGDSLTQAGTYTGEVVTIAGSDVMGVSLIGTRGAGSNKHEGRGGWRVDDFATAGRTFYQFTVSGVTTVPAINSTEYTNNGSTFKVQEVSITGGAGTITCERTSGSNAPSASGTLTKSNAGAGDSSISFSASTTVSGNPFWISGALNFPQYLVNNSLATPDWVFIMLGTNDVFSATSDSAVTTAAASSFDNLDLLIASIKAAGAGVKVALMTPPPPSASQDAFGHDYAVGQTRWRFKRNIMFYNQALIARYRGKEADRVYICPVHTNLDTVNNMSVAASAPVNSRSSVSVQRQNNGVHPATEGYKQIADSVWCFLKNNG
jgi:lysophospholipase L1-like esterase